MRVFSYFCLKTLMDVALRYFKAPIDSAIKYGLIPSPAMREGVRACPGLDPGGEGGFSTLFNCRINRYLKHLKTATSHTSFTRRRESRRFHKLLVAFVVNVRPLGFPPTRE
jgi:hypothetical protein